MDRLMKAALVSLLGLLALPLSAATVALDPPSQDVLPDGPFSVELLLNTEGLPGPTNNGTFRITWDSAKAGFDGFVGPMAEPLDVDVMPQVPGNLIVSFTDANGQPFDGSLGTFNFSATAPQGDMIVINVGCPFPAASQCLFSGDPGSTIGFRPESAEANVNVVPIPAAVWLFGSALAGMFGWSKRRAVLRTS